MTPVAIIFDNFGPYHVARLQTAASRCDLLAIEVAGVSGTYSWKNDATTKFKRVTLIEGATSADVSSAELVQRLTRALDQFDPRVVIVPGWASPAAWGAMQWCLQKQVPMVCLSDSTEWDEPRTFWKEWIKQQLVQSFSSALVAGKRATDYLAKLGMPRERIFPGFDVVDNDYFSDKATDVQNHGQEIRNQYGLPANYFLVSARFVEKKNLPRLLEAYALYRNSGSAPWSLVLLGDGALRPELEAKRDSLCLKDHLVMPGFKQYGDLPAYYALAGAFILPSVEEPWGLVVNEAIASGLPVLVSSRCGCVPELVSDGVNGFAFDPFNVAELAQYMQQVSSDDFPIAAFRENSRKIIGQWNLEKFAQGMMQAIDAALAAPPVTAGMIQRILLGTMLRR